MATTGQNPVTVTGQVSRPPQGRSRWPLTLSADDARTVLAGWDPDQTFWLTEVLAASGPATNWVDLDDGPLGWTLSNASA